MVFTFSITPKRIFHMILANHTDATSCDLKTQQVKKLGFNCDCDNLVAESPFTNDIASIELIIPLAFVGQHKLQRVTFISTLPPYSCLRGPPSLV
jgi:hypothetical protein